MVVFTMGLLGIWWVLFLFLFFFFWFLVPVGSGGMVGMVVVTGLFGFFNGFARYLVGFVFVFVFFFWVFGSGGILVGSGQWWRVGSDWVVCFFFFFLINLEFWFLWDFSGQWWHSGHGGHVYIWL